jgi:hypothetical protein
VLKANKYYLWIVIVSVLSQIYFFNRGFTPHDEGNILHASQRLLNGEVIYRDFDFPYTPGTIYSLALSSKLLGEGILSGRFLMLFVNTLSCLIIFKIAQVATKRHMLGLIASTVFLSWGPTHINFPWPTMFAILFGSSTVLLILLAIKHEPQKYLFFAGITTFITFIFKQNFGVALVLINTFASITSKKVRNKNSLLLHLLGIFLPALMFEIYLIKTNSLLPFIDNFYRITIQEIVVGKSLSTPFIYEHNLPGYIKAAFYLTPAIISLFSIYILLKHSKSRVFLFLCIYVLVFYLFGIRPVTDYNHLSPLLSISGIPLSLSVANTNNIKVRNLLLLFTTGLIFLGFYTGLFKGYYRWETPLSKQNIYLSSPRAYIYTDNKYFSIIKTIGPLIERHSDKDDYIFSYKHAPMFYFLFDRKNPTQYLSVGRGSFVNVSKNVVINQLKTKKVKLVILQSYETNTADEVIRYVQKNYFPLLQSPDYTLLKKK